MSIAFAAFLALFIYSLFTAIMSKSVEGGAKLIWVLVIIFLPVIGSILWLVIKQPWKEKSDG